MLNNNSKIGIVYVCTYKYNMCFDTFLQSLEQNFYPENKKEIILLSDQLERFNNYDSNNVHIQYYYLRHYPWPINTLFKMHYIYEYLQCISDCDIIFYFNANIEFHQLLNDYSIFSEDKLYLSPPYNDYSPKCAMEGLKIPTNSTAYIDNDEYIYVRGWMFAGSYNILKELCENVIQMCNTDLHNCIIPPWHDESYLNKYVYEHQNIIKILFKSIGDEWNIGSIASISDKKAKYNFNKYSI